MADWDNLEDEEEDKTISLDDLENLEHDKEREDDPRYDEDDWGDSFDDLDSEGWERQYGQEDEDVEKDPWELG